MPVKDGIKRRVIDQRYRAKKGGSYQRIEVSLPKWCALELLKLAAVRQESRQRLIETILTSPTVLRYFLKARKPGG